MIGWEYIGSHDTAVSPRDKDGIIPHTDLLELLLSYTDCAADKVTVAENIVSGFEQAENCFWAESEGLLKIDGITHDAAALIRLIGRLFNLYINPNLVYVPHVKFDEAFAFLANGAQEENIWAVAVDREDIACVGEHLAQGEAARSGVRVGDAALFAGRHTARRIVLAHYHPDMEYPLISRQDILAVQYMGDTLARLGITLVGHTVIARKGSRFFRYAFD
ncbi:MAG: hypothetical protein IJY93_03650 [Clostridia bacterium]|nr:hypothetical protein [Clostridia bacterium]